MKFSIRRRERSHGSRYWTVAYDNDKWVVFLSPALMRDLLGLKYDEAVHIARTYYGYLYDGEPTILFAQRHQAEKFMDEYLVPRCMMKEMSGNAANN